MTISRALFATAMAVAALGSPAAAQKGPTAAELLRLAQEYLTTYAPRVSGVTLEEQYTMTEVSSGHMLTPVRLSSDLVLLNLGGRVIALRDPFAVDSQPLRAKEPRITTLLAKPTPAAWDQAQAYVNESMVHFPLDLIVKLNEPTLALHAVAPANESRLTYKIDGRKKLDGVETVALRFDEPKNLKASYIFPTGGNALASGRLWIDPSTGRIHRTDLSLQSSIETARISVTYARDPSLDLWLPTTMYDDYGTSEPTGGVNVMGVGSYNARRAFECRATYSNARLTPIELTVASAPHLR